MKLLLYCLLALLCAAGNCFAQAPPSPSPATIYGTVLSGQSPQVATVQAINNKNMVATNTQGGFKMRLYALPDTLLISSVGFTPVKIAVTTNTPLPLLVQLVRLQQNMQQVIVSSGYQSIAKERATGSFVKINNELFNQRITTDVMSRLDGIAGSLLADHRPGNEGQLQIRGISSLRVGTTAPLIVVDNFPYEGDITNINPNDVESITLLKDAAAQSIWGARAGNGVIVITTKKGTANQPLTITASASVTIRQKPNLFSIPQVAAKDIIGIETNLFNNGYYDADLASSYFPALTPAVEILQQQRNGDITQAQATDKLNALGAIDNRHDFEKYIYRTAVNQQYALNISGGAKNIKYYLSGGYDKSPENLIGNQYSRTTFRTDNTITPFKNAEISTTFQYTNTAATSNSPGAYGAYTVNGKKMPAYVALANADGTPNTVDVNYRGPFTDTVGNGSLLNWKYAPLQELHTNNNTSQLQDMLLNLGFRYALSQALSAEIKYQYESSIASNQNYYSLQSFFARNLINTFTQQTADGLAYAIPKQGILDETQNKLAAHAIRGQLNYNAAFGSLHKLTGIAGAELRQDDSHARQNRTYGFNDQLGTFYDADMVNSFETWQDLGGISNIPGNKGFAGTHNRFVSLYANAAYTYNNKYVFSASARKDASNIFGVSTNHKWAPLWSAGAAWNISDEKFYRSAAVPYLKLRATYGYSGSIAKDVSAYTTIAYYDHSSSVINLPFAAVSTAPNSELSWQKAGMLNVGVDFATARKTITGSIEWYKKNTKDLLGSQTLDPTTGFSYVTSNSADLSGHGIDIELNTLNINKKIKWQTSFFWSYVKTNVTRYLFTNPDMATTLLSDGAFVNPVAGLPPYSIVSYKWGGLDNTGDPLGYLDGKLSKDYTALQSTPLARLVVNGPALPPVFGNVLNTISFRHFSLSANITYRLGYYFRKPSLVWNQAFDYLNINPDYYQRWQNPGDENKTTVPAMIYPANNNRDAFYQYASINVLKADNVKLQYINLSYTVDKASHPQLPVKNIQLFVYADNLNVLLWKANKAGLDPEYPYALKPSKSISMGCRINF